MEILRHLAAFFFPERCPYCGAVIEACEIACEKCSDELAQKHTPIKGGARGYRCVSSFAYGGKARRLILRVKYRDRTQFIPQIAVILAEDIRNAYGKDAFDLITSVPMYKSDYRKRQYNQSELLAKALSKELKLPYRETLKKIKKTKKQHQLSFTERKTNLNGAFELIDKDSLKDQRILLIDDIITSGHTLGKCCKVLNHAKPALICCATVASAREKYPKDTLI